MLELALVPDLTGEAPPVVLAASATVAEAARALAASGQPALALVDGEGRFAALLTAEAFVRFVAAGGDAEASPASGLAAASVDPLAADDSALDVLMLMARRGAVALPVLDDGGQLLGIVSRARVLAVAEAALQRAYQGLQSAVFGARGGEG